MIIKVSSIIKATEIKYLKLFVYRSYSAISIAASTWLLLVNLLSFLNFYSKFFFSLVISELEIKPVVSGVLLSISLVLVLSADLVAR